MYIKRDIYPTIRDHLEKPEITLITGPRQAGKTTLIRHLESELHNNNQKTVYLNLDIESDFALVQSQETLLFALKNQVGEQRAYVFIDEFQRKGDGGRFLKGLYDMNLPYKFIITGSGSIELKEQVHESLAGRKQTFEMDTLSFEEYLNHETDYAYESNLPAYARIYPERAQLYLHNYLTFGGYPRLALVDSIEEKRNLLQEIYSSYLLKDITALLQIEKTLAFQKLVESMSILDGKLVNISNLAKHIGLASQTIEKYLWYLEQTYILRPVRPFSGNPLREINKSYTYYFRDLGLKNLISAQFDPPSDRVNWGFDFQNYVFLALHQRLQSKQPAGVHFWRTNDGAEMDFVIKRGKHVIGVECKHHAFAKPAYTRSMRSFIDKYRPEAVYIVNTTLTHEESIDGTPVRFMPFLEMDSIVSRG